MHESFEFTRLEQFKGASNTYPSGRTRFADVPANLIDTGVKSFNSLFRGSPEGRQPLLAITSSPRFKGSLMRSLCEPPAWEVSRLSP